MNIWILIGIALGIGILVYVVISVGQRKELQAISSKREHISERQFLDHFIELGYDEDITLELRNQIKFYVPKRDFSMSPTDGLTEMYRADEEDLVDIAMKLFEKKHNVKPNKLDIALADKNDATIDTFEGILKFVHQEPVANNA